MGKAVARARGARSRSESTRTPEFVGRRQTDHPPASASALSLAQGSTAERAARRRRGSAEAAAEKIAHRINQLVFFPIGVAHLCRAIPVLPLINSSYNCSYRHWQTQLL